VAQRQNCAAWLPGSITVEEIDRSDEA